MDWDGLERALVHRSADSEAFLDTRSGEVVEVTRGWSDDHGFTEAELAEGLAAGRLVVVEPLPHETQVGWLRGFVSSLADDWPRDALEQALTGPAPLRAFEDALGRFPAERTSWIACRRGRVKAVLRAWAEANDIEPDAPLDPIEGLDQMEG